MEVTKTVKATDGNKRIPVGTIEVPLFDLKDFGLITQAAVFEEGVLSYQDARFNFVQQAVTAALKAAARNALQPGTAKLKQGCRIDSSIEEVLEASQARNGEALRAYREAVSCFVGWLASHSGKKVAVQTLYASMAKSRQAIEVATKKAKEGFIAAVMAFVEGLPTEEAERYSAALQGMIDAASVEVVLLEEEDY